MLKLVWLKPCEFNFQQFLAVPFTAMDCLTLLIPAAGMEETSCGRKAVLQNLVGDISNFWVTEGPFGRIRAKNKDTACE